MFLVSIFMSDIRGPNGTVDKCLQVIDYMGFCSQMQDEEGMRTLLKDMLEIGYTLVGDKETIEKDVYKGFVFFASMADRKLNSENTPQYGETMDLVNKIFLERELDIGDYKTYKYAVKNPTLN